jgi:lipoprotein-releasing system permease protein
MPAERAFAGTMMGLSSYLALRFVGSRRSPVVLIVSVLAVSGIALGVMVMNVTLAVMNGFRDEIQMRFVENMPMVTVLSWQAEGLADLAPTLERVDALPDVVAAAPFLRQPGILTRVRPGLPERHQACVLWGIDASRQFEVTPLHAAIEPPFTGFGTHDLVGEGRGLPGLVLGIELAAGLAAGLGDVVTLTVPTGHSRRLEETQAATADFAVVGLLETGMFEFDNSFAYADIELARELCGRIAVDGIGVRVREMMDAEAAGERIAEQLGPPYWTNDWIRMNSQLFEWISMEKTLMFLLLALMTLVSVFSVIAILTMIVRDRQFEIAVLRSFGVTRASIQWTFLKVGMCLGGLGIAAGTLLALGVIAYLHFVGLRLPGEVYFVDRVPALVRLSDVLSIIAVTLLFSLLATVLPSRIAASFRPVDILRHE